MRVTDFRVELVWAAHNVGAEGLPAKTGHKFNSTFSLSFVHLSHKRFEIQTNKQTILRENKQTVLRENQEVFC